MKKHSDSVHCMLILNLKLKTEELVVGCRHNEAVLIYSIYVQSRAIIMLTGYTELSFLLLKKTVYKKKIHLIYKSSSLE